MATRSSENAFVELTFEVRRDLLEAVKVKLDHNGSDITTLLRMAMKSYLGRPDVFHLETVFTFGKYRDESLEAVLRTDTKYVLWCLANLPAFNLSEEANELLNQLLPQTGMAVRRYEQGGAWETVVFVPDEKPLDVPAK